MANQLFQTFIQQNLAGMPMPAGFENFIQALNTSFDRYEKKINHLESTLASKEEELNDLHNKLLNETADLKNTHAELSKIFNSVNEGFFTKDILANKYINMSVGCDKIYGYTTGDFFANSNLWYEVIHPEDKVLVEQEDEILNRGEQVKSTYRIVHKDNSIRWIEVKAIPFVVNGILKRVDGVVNDVTERKTAEKAIIDILSTSEEKTRLIMSAALDAIIWMDNTDIITYWNPQAERIFGWKESDAKGKRLSDLIIPAQFRQMHRNGLQHYLKTGHGPALNMLLELSAIDREGKEFPIELTILPIKQAGEEFFCAFVRDISDRKRAQKQIIDSERRYRTLFEQNLAGVYQITAKGKIINCNNAFAKMLGYQSPLELLQTNAVDLYFSPGEREDFVTTLRAEKKLYNYEVMLKHRDGSTLHMLENISLFKDPVTGEEICDGIIINITARKKAEALLQESEERYRQIVETAQEGIWMMDDNYSTIFVNKKMSELLEYSADEMMGKAPTYFMTDENRVLGTASLNRRSQGISENFDLPFVTKSGKQLWTNLSASPILNNQGEIIGGLAMVTDITKRKTDEELIRKSEATLDLKNKELERKNTELEQFAYVASHDLQEPLRTTSSFVKMLQQQYHGKLDEKADQYLSFIIESSDRMKVLIKDLLDYSRIGIKNELKPVDCNKVLQDVIADLNKAITEAGALIRADNLPVINGYPTEIKQLFQNLIINAIKFRKKNVIPRLNISAATAGDAWIFAFEDNGIGIDKAHNERIFVIFQRLHTRTEYQGSGIGLSHCKKIVELHHGKIWVESTPGEGSTFYFSIPGCTVT